MFRRMHRVIAALLVALLLGVSTSVASAQEPVSPQQIKAIRDAATWAETITPEQRAAINDILAQHEEAFDAVTSRLRNLENPQGLETLYLPHITSNGSSAAVASSTQSYVAPPLSSSEQTALQAATADLQALQAEVESAVSEVLTPEQRAQHEQALTLLDSMASSVQAAPAATETEYYSYEYNYYGYYYAYYAYIYSDYTYAYYSYYYNYYGYYYAYYAYLGY